MWTQKQLEAVQGALFQGLPTSISPDSPVVAGYLSILRWILAEREKVVGLNRPWMVGLNAPQGAGKSTMTAALVRGLSALGYQAVTLSIDDFYLTRAEQVSLAMRYSDHPLLAQRGYPGTHDVKLGASILRQLREFPHSGMGASKVAASSPVGRSVLIPRYEKSLHQGQGDRLAPEQGLLLQAPLDVVFLEGWMLAFPVLSEEKLQQRVMEYSGQSSEAFRQFQIINELLKPYDRWVENLDALVQLVPLDVHDVLRWRVEAEERMKAQGKPGMSLAEITAYVEKFILAYHVYLPELVSHPPKNKPVLQVSISRSRQLSFSPLS
ncbi:MAG: hypothetical protein ACO3A2_09765 [Bdellovibrionia bacterium]